MKVKIKFSPPLRPGILIKRYKRFLADVRFENGKTATVHCPNTGSMKSCSEPGRPVRLSYHPDTGRKYVYTWEMIQMDKIWVGVNTGIPNNLVDLAVRYGAVPELIGHPTVRREVPYAGRSRIDLLLEGPAGRCYVEVKNVSLAEGDVVCFPDAVTQRGLKHLEDLMAMRRNGDRAVMMYIVQRSDGRVFKPADHIDREYGRMLRRAKAAGVEILAYRAEVSPEAILWGDLLPVQL